MLMMALQIVSLLALFPFFFIWIIGLMILAGLPKAKVQRGIGDWSKMALVCSDNRIQPASELIAKMRNSVLGLLASMAMIVMTYTVLMYNPEAVKDVQMFKLMSLGTGLLAGIATSISCIYYGNLVRWNLLGVPQRRG